MYTSIDHTKRGKQKRHFSFYPHTMIHGDKSIMFQLFVCLGLASL